MPAAKTASEDRMKTTDTNHSRPLDTFKPGAQVRIEGLCDCPRARGRLCALGLTPGTTVTVNSNGHGPCRLKVRGSDLVIGRGLARKVLACDLSSADESAPAVSCPCCHCRK
jgi:ferrous iron transport protein A